MKLLQMHKNLFGDIEQTKFKHLPTVNPVVLANMLTSDNPLSVIDEFLLTITDASEETKNTISLQYLFKCAEIMALESDQANRNNTDDILSVDDFERVVAAGSSIRDRYEASIDTNSKIADNSIAKFTNSESTTDRTCLIVGSNELKDRILNEIPKFMHMDIDVILLKGETINKNSLIQLQLDYGTVILDSTVTTLVAMDRELNRKLEMIDIESLPPKVAESYASVSPIFNPKERGRKKGGFKGGHRRF